MGGFHDVRFPDAIARGATGGPGFDTTVIATVSGIERRNVNWSAARGRWDVGSGVRSREDLEALIAFFRARQGRAHGFRFRDWSDYRAVASPLGVGDGATRGFQLVKWYVSGPTEVARVLTRPVAGQVTVYRDGAPVAAGVTVDTATGVVTFATAPAAGVAVAADVDFDVPVRFDTDHMALSLDTCRTGSWQQVPLVEIRT